MRHEGLPEAASSLGPLLVAVCFGIATLAVTACDGDGNGERAANHGAGPSQIVAVRDCEAEGASASRGRQLDLDSDQNVHAGPLTLYLAGQYAESPPSEFAPIRFLRNAPPGVRAEIRTGSLYPAVKLLLVFRGIRAVTIEIPEAERRQASLLYAATRSHTVQEQRLGLAQISDGRRAVRFVPCRGPGRFTEFPGGLVVAGARCLPLDIWVTGRDEPIRRFVSFGAGDPCTPVRG